MTLADLVDLVTCPTCGGPFRLTGRTLGCPAGHRIDLARQGYANLLGHAAPRHADTGPMVAARDAFLAAGHYAPIAAGIAAALPRPARTVVESGAGTGYYLAAALAAAGPESRGLAVDISAYACRRAARLPRVGAVVADVWAGLPVVANCADAVLAVFAPRNVAEFARILAPAGRLVVVTPRPEHLASLRAELGLLDVEDDKLGRLDAAVRGHLRAVERSSIRAPLELSAVDVQNLVMMGPNAFHRDAEAAWAAASTELAVDVSVYTR